MKTVRECVSDAIMDWEGTKTTHELADSILSALKEAGWVCVPVEPNGAMRRAGAQADEFRSLGIGKALHIWNAMIAASQDQGRE